MPRCGHHFLERLLGAAFHGSYEYCDFYVAKECCKTVPCKKNASLMGDHTRVFYQKNHDLDLTLPRNINSDLALVQYRNPVDQSIANFDNYTLVFKHENFARYMPHVLAANAWYYVRFFRKWIQGPPEDVFLLKYEYLAAHPVESIQKIAAAISMPMFEPKLEEQLPKISTTDGAGHAFFPRNYTTHRFFDEDIFAATEHIIFNNCDGLDYDPIFDRAPDQDTLILMQVLLASEMAKDKGIERVRLLRRALEIRPDLPNVANLLASTLLSLGENEQALGASEQAIALDPLHPDLLAIRGRVAFAMGDYGYAEEFLSAAESAGCGTVPHTELLQRVRELRTPQWRKSAMTEEIDGYFKTESTRKKSYLGQLNPSFQESLADYHAGVEEKDCEFNHTIDAGNRRVYTGAWDLRGHEQAYFGNYDFAGKRVLEAGPGSGFLSAYLAWSGADLVVLDLPIGRGPELVPFRGLDLAEQRFAGTKSAARVRNSWWFTKRALGFNASAIYADIYEPPSDIGCFDVTVFGAILLRLSNPFLALQKLAALTDNAIVVTDVFSGPSSPESPAAGDANGGANMIFAPSPLPNGIVHWWSLSPEAISFMLEKLGFPHTTITRHSPKKMASRPALFTVVAQRNAPDGRHAPFSASEVTETKAPVGRRIWDRIINWGARKH